MANEPERPIERLLRAVAQKRRDDAGARLELHPATRRLLQGEVARTFAKAGRETHSWPAVLGQLWPRFAWGVAISAVLATTVYVLLPAPGKGRSEVRLARNEPLSRAAAARPAPEPSPIATSPAPEPVTESAPAPIALNAPTPGALRMERQAQPLAKDAPAAPAEPRAKEELAPPAAPRPDGLSKSTEREIAASGGTLDQAPVAPADGTLQRRLRALPRAAPAPSPTAAPAAPPPAPVATAPAPVTQVTAGETAKLNNDKANPPALAFKAIPPAPSAQPTPIPSDRLLQSSAEALPNADSASSGQRYTRTAPGPGKKRGLDDSYQASTPVLGSFKVEQRGSELRIVDGDGSVYSGYVQAPASFMGKPSAQAGTLAGSRASDAAVGALEQKAPARREAAQPAPPTYFFRVAGTNRSLNQAVVFTGNLTAATNASQAQPLTNAFYSVNRIGTDLTASPQPVPAPLFRSRISGKVVVGDGKPVEINALPANP